ncbi:MAG TPA: riboflavin synthase [Gemmatimonadaceae bacterium]|jgi:riboflavin synthase|nr:riboflavin synthase [Gemmatimonadaceae bacterium]
MFTGLVDDVGTLDRVGPTDAGLEFRVRCRYTDLALGESIALNGVCLTVLAHGPNWFTVAAMTTTLGRTTLEHWTAGGQVNLERALCAGDRLGGHMVQGHVDGVGTVLDTRDDGSAWLVDIEIPAELFELMVPHGSLAVDGVSLTVNALPGDAVVQVSLIDYTRRHTTLGALRAGSRVHIEADVIGKYVRRLVAPYTSNHV